MVNLVSTIAIIWVVFIAILYQFLFKGLIFGVLGYGRSFRSLSLFNVQCKKIDQLGLEACEDMWLHEPTGYLYMACGDSEGKTRWLPSYVASLMVKGKC
jgi:arylesterase/paraoxonase